MYASTALKDTLSLTGLLQRCTSAAFFNTKSENLDNLNALVDRFYSNFSGMKHHSKMDVISWYY